MTHYASPLAYDDDEPLQLAEKTMSDEAKALLRKIACSDSPRRETPELLELARLHFIEECAAVKGFFQVTATGAKAAFP